MWTMPRSTMTETFSEFHSSVLSRINPLLNQQLSAITAPERLRSAMHYAVMNGGKRLRPTMAYAAFATVEKLDVDGLSKKDSSYSLVDSSATALELIHSYSLVHDDLPAMDDDDLRRGKPTCHIEFDEATAILAGDALQTLAFELLSDDAALDAHMRLRLVNCLAKGSGADGMVGGQMVDLQATGTQDCEAFDLPQLEAMHRAKTGALIGSAVRMGAVCAAASEADLAVLDEYSAHIGLAFQVVDDVLDLTGSTEQLGKPQGADVALGKATYPSLMGLGEAREYAQSLCGAAHAKASYFGVSGALLQGLADYLATRNY